MPVDQFTISGMHNAFETACIDYRVDSDLALRPRFLTNDYQLGERVLSALESELLDCDEFFFSVAFINRGGIEPLLMTLRELENRGNT